MWRSGADTGGLTMHRSTSDRGRLSGIGPARVGVVLLAVLALCAGLVASVADGAPSSATDESKVPHYFGPYPNWAHSPLTNADATVKISADGTGATADATVGANGAVTGLTIMTPGSGYTSATVDS